MTKPETLIKYLPCHTTYGDFELCAECPYNPHPGKIWEFGCAHGQDKMIDEAIAMLKGPERKVGEWIVHAEVPKRKNAFAQYRVSCSVCKYNYYALDYSIVDFDFCPNCGADMRKWGEKG